MRRGLPHLIHDYSASTDVLTRAAPFLAFVVFLQFFLVFGDRWAGWAQAAVFVLGFAAAAGVVAIVNRLRGRRTWQLPDRVGVLELLAYFALPSLFAGLGATGAVVVDVLFFLAVNALLLAGAYMVTSWGLVPMVRWSVGQFGRQIGQMMTLLAKSLPLLLLFSAFIFLNAEVWQVAHDFTLPYFGMVAALLVAVGTLFVTISVRRLAVDLARFSTWDDVRSRCEGTPVEPLVPADSAEPPRSPPLSRRARFNVSLLLFVARRAGHAGGTAGARGAPRQSPPSHVWQPRNPLGIVPRGGQRFCAVGVQSIQIMLVALIVTVFYVLFGMFTVREETLLNWTTLSELTWSEAWAVPVPLWGGELLFTRPLVLVSAFIGLFSGLQFAVSVVLDAGYRSEFAEDMTGELREALAVRAVYYRALVEEAPLSRLRRAGHRATRRTAHQ